MTARSCTRMKPAARALLQVRVYRGGYSIEEKAVIETWKPAQCKHVDTREISTRELCIDQPLICSAAVRAGSDYGLRTGSQYDRELEPGSAPASMISIAHCRILLRHTHRADCCLLQQSNSHYPFASHCSRGLTADQTHIRPRPRPPSRPRSSIAAVCCDNRDNEIHAKASI